MHKRFFYRNVVHSLKSFRFCLISISYTLTSKLYLCINRVPSIILDLRKQFKDLDVVVTSQHVQLRH